MKKLYEICLNRAQACLTEAADHPGRFFRLVTEKTAFILNIVLIEEAFIEVTYGFTSTAFFALGPGEKEFFLKEGCRSDDATLRRCMDILSKEELSQAEANIREFYESHREMDKDSLLAEAKEMRKEFLSQVGALLKPHKFRKKGNVWTKQLENGLTAEFHAQKSAFSDEYYFNIRSFPTGKSPYPGCFQTRITAGSSDIFDWQLLDRQALLAALETDIQQKLLPFLTMPPESLGRERWVWEGCCCRRTCCESCWVEKNLWESQERGN